MPKLFANIKRSSENEKLIHNILWKLVQLLTLRRDATNPASRVSDKASLKPEMCALKLRVNNNDTINAIALLYLDFIILYCKA